MSTWPTTLPQYPLLNGYQVSPLDPVLRTEMEGSNTRSRRITTARKDKIPVMWRMTDQQYYIFRLWFDDPAGANGGASWFYIQLKTGNAGIEVETVEAIFCNSIWKAQLVDPNRWEISATLEIRYA